MRKHMNLKTIGIISAGVMMAGTLAACSSGTTETETTVIEETETETESTSAETEIETTAALTSEEAQAQSWQENAGTYKGLYTKFVGDDDDKKDKSDDFSLELKEDGTGISKRDGNEYELTWDVVKGEFTMKETFLGIEIEYTGTLEDGALDIFNDDPENPLTCEYVYEKQ